MRRLSSLQGLLSVASLMDETAFEENAQVVVESSYGTPRFSADFGLVKRRGAITEAAAYHKTALSTSYRRRRKELSLGTSSAMAVDAWKPWTAGTRRAFGCILSICMVDYASIWSFQYSRQSGDCDR